MRSYYDIDKAFSHCLKNADNENELKMNQLNVNFDEDENY